jgi:N-methylhydantoinase B
VVKCLLSSDLPVNEGFYSQLEFSAPPGTVVNSGPPCGVVGGAEVSMRVCDLAFRAFADGMRDKIPACGKSTVCHMACGGDPQGRDSYAFLETLAGGYGARPNKDGMDAVQAHFQNTENSAIEEIENHYPMRILRYSLVEDSEGAGKYRGGLGVRRDWKFLDHETTFTIFSESAIFAPWGLWGGESAAKARFLLNPDQEHKELRSKVTLVLKPDAVVSYRTPGGGGLGPVEERDPAAVLRDAIDGKISRKRVRDTYGVVIDYKKRLVDVEATRRLKIKLARAKKIRAK